MGKHTPVQHVFQEQPVAQRGPRPEGNVLGLLGKVPGRGSFLPRVVAERSVRSGAATSLAGA